MCLSSMTRPSSDYLSLSPNSLLECGHESGEPYGVDWSQISEFVVHHVCSSCTLQGCHERILFDPCEPHVLQCQGVYAAGKWCVYLNYLTDDSYLTDDMIRTYFLCVPTHHTAVFVSHLLICIEEYFEDAKLIESSLRVLSVLIACAPESTGAAEGNFNCNLPVVITYAKAIYNAFCRLFHFRRSYFNLHDAVFE